MLFPKPKRIKNRKLLDTFHGKKCLIRGCNYLSDPAHVKSVGAGGNDTEDDVLNLCRLHHGLQHSKGHFYMAKTFPEYKKALDDRGWEFTIHRKLIKK